MRVNVSVCMATFNGAKYLNRQLDSILLQLQENDEIVIVDDCSTDNTVSLIKAYSLQNIKLFVNKKNYGHVKSFEIALSLAAHDIILLSDQDDVWIPGRLNTLIYKLGGDQSALLTSNFGLIDENDVCLPDPKCTLLEIDSTAYIKNYIGLFLGKRPYFGCAMILRKGLLEIALPFPVSIEGHDVWLAFCANALKSNSHLEAKTINRRLHSGNLTSINRRSIFRVALTRYRMFICTIILSYRLVHKYVRILSIH